MHEAAGEALHAEGLNALSDGTKFFDSLDKYYKIKDSQDVPEDEKNRMRKELNNTAISLITSIGNLANTTDNQDMKLALNLMKASLKMANTALFDGGINMSNEEQINLVLDIFEPFATIPATMAGAPGVVVNVVGTGSIEGIKKINEKYNEYVKDGKLEFDEIVNIGMESVVTACAEGAETIPGVPALINGVREMSAALVTVIKNDGNIYMPDYSMSAADVINAGFEKNLKMFKNVSSPEGFGGGMSIGGGNGLGGGVIGSGR